MKLTKATITNLEIPEGKSEGFYWDDDLPCFGIRVRGNSRRYVLQYRHGHQQRRESLGDIRKITLDAARKIARQRFAAVELGTDPVADIRKAKEEQRVSFGSIVERYLKAKQGAIAEVSYKQIKLHLTVFFSIWEKKPINGIGRADIALKLQDIIENRGRVAAAKARSNLSSFYTWAMREGLTDSNPVISTNNPADNLQSRERVLSDAEISLVWNACEENEFGKIVRLLILTGCRKSEIGGLMWDEVNLDAGIITIPKERTKNRREHALRLPPIALDIIRSVRRRPGNEHLFGLQKGFTSWSSPDDARLKSSVGNIPHWTIHDLRRTFRTGLGKLGISPHIAELAINHTKGGIQAVYDKHRYEPEITAALLLWADHVVEIT